MSQVEITGPLFNGTAQMVVDQFVNAAVSEVSRRGEEIVHEHADSSFKKPTGFYESQINVRRPNKAEAVVSDGGVIYGPWLEGVSSRNQSTRFKGYALWRRTSQRLQQETPKITRSVLSRYIRRLGG